MGEATNRGDAQDAYLYSVPKSDDAFIGELQLFQAESLRRANIQREVSIRAVGWLFLLSVSPHFVMGLATQLSSTPGGHSCLPPPGFDVLVMSIALLALGWGYVSLSPWARLLGIALHAIGSIASLGLVGLVIDLNEDDIILFVCLNAINAFMLWLLVGKQSCFVCSSRYQVVRRATPHIECERPTIPCESSKVEPLGRFDAR